MMNKNETSSENKAVDFKIGTYSIGNEPVAYINPEAAIRELRGRGVVLTVSLSRFCKERLKKAMLEM